MPHADYAKLPNSHRVCTRPCCTHLCGCAPCCASVWDVSLSDKVKNDFFGRKMLYNMSVRPTQTAQNCQTRTVYAPDPAADVYVG